MTDQPKNIKSYSADDFQRYYSGRMTALEMHELEKAALDDPFLEDALEGYKLTATPVQDIAALQTAIEAKTEKGKVVSLSGSTGWLMALKIAAMVLLVAGIGWVVYNVGFKTHSNDIALQPEPKFRPSIESKEKDDTGTGAMNPPIEENNNAASTLSKKTAPQNSSQQKKIFHPTKQERQSKDAPLVTATPTKKNINSSPELNEETGVANIPVSGIGNTDSGAVARQNSIAARTKKQPHQMAKTDSRSHDPVIYFNDAEPINGRMAFDAYIAQNLQRLDTTIEKNAVPITLLFDINNEGEAINIEAEKSLCRQCVEEAIRLLKEGPKWHLNKKKQKILINF